MTARTKLEKKEESQKKKSGFVFKFVLIAILFVAGIVFLVQQKPELFKDTKLIEVDDKKERAEPDNSLVTDALNDEYSVGAEPPLPSFAPKLEESEEVEDENNEPPLMPIPKDPYDKIVEKEGATEVAIREKVAKELDEYRLYLANANRLIANFKADQPYGAELTKLKAHKLPAHSKKIIVLLEEYNTYLANTESLENQEVEPFDSALLSKFVKIKKVPLKNKKQEDLKQDIEMQLKMFVDYLYSDDLQNSFVNR